MAGRGTDILLGGNAELLAKSGYEAMNVDWRTIPEEELQEAIDRKKRFTDADKEQVVSLGGLHIIGTERHESRRIDNQLRGRAARQGDPGSTHFFLSLEDGLMRKFGGERIASMMDMMGVEETMPISARMVSGAIERAQRKVEAYYFDIRKNILQYDDVLTEQRKLIYDQRRQVLNGENLRESIRHMVQQSMERLVTMHFPAQATPDEWDDNLVNDMLATAHAICPALSQITADTIRGQSGQQVTALLAKQASEAYLNLEAELERVSEELRQTHGVSLSGLDEEDGLTSNESLLPEQAVSTVDKAETNHPLRRIERDILLSVIDNRWIDYLHNLDGLRDGIGLRAYGQKDPLIEYKREAFEMFQNLTYEIQRDTVMTLFNTRIEIQLQRQMDDSTAFAETAEMHHTPLSDALAGIISEEQWHELQHLSASSPAFLDLPLDVSHEVIAAFDPEGETPSHEIREAGHHFENPAHEVGYQETAIGAPILGEPAFQEQGLEQDALRQDEDDHSLAPTDSDDFDRPRKPRVTKSKPF